MKAVADLQKDLANNRGGDLFFPQGKIEDETNIRLLPTLPNMNGDPCRKVVKWFINNKPYTSAETFGEPCVIKKYLDNLKADLAKKPDKTLHALLTGKTAPKRKTEFYLPMLLLNGEGEKEVDGVMKPDIIGVRVLQCGPMLMDSIVDILTKRFAQNGTEWGLMDRSAGWNLSLSKSGKDLATEYKAVQWPQPMRMPKKYYEPDQIPDIFTMVENMRHTDDYLLSVIENYIDGTPIREEDEDGEDAAPARTTVRGKVSAKPVAGKKHDVMRDLARLREEEEDEEAGNGDEEEEAPRKGKAAPPSNKKRPPADEEDEDGDEEEEDEEAPPAKSKKVAPPAAKKKASVDEEEEDEDDEDEDEEEPASARKKAPAPSKSRPVTKGSKGKSDTSDLNDD